MSESSDEYPASDEEILDLMSIYLFMRTAQVVVKYANPFYNKIPYHTSALSGEAWVLELLNGHPKRIRCELGVHSISKTRAICTNLLLSVVVLHSTCRHLQCWQLL